MTATHLDLTLDVQFDPDTTDDFYIGLVSKKDMNEKDVRTPQESFTDKAGREVKVGDIIAYGHALGRCAGLRIGKVLKIERVKKVYMRREADWSIQVRGIDDSWGHTGPALCKKNGTLQYPDRAVKLDVIPDAMAKLLEGV